MSPLLKTKTSASFILQVLPNKMILSIQYLWMTLHNYFTIRNCSSREPVVENDVEW